jgi:hypothetical protein
VHQASRIGRTALVLAGAAAAVLLIAVVVGPHIASANGGFGGWFGGRGVLGGKSAVDNDALLAQALGISVQDLQAARTKAAEMRIDQAVKSEDLTQKQADRMRAELALQPYVNQDALVAAVLGMTVDDLNKELAGGSTLSDLLQKAGLDRSTLRDKLDAAREAAIQKAVTDKVITADQAKSLEDSGWMGGCLGDMGFGLMGGRMGRMGPMGRRGQFGLGPAPNQQQPNASATPGSSSSAVRRFRGLGTGRM